MGTVQFHAENYGDYLMVPEDDPSIFIKKDGVFVGRAADLDPEDEPYLAQLTIEPGTFGQTLISRLSIPRFILDLEANIEHVDNEFASFEESFSTIDHWVIISSTSPQNPNNNHWLFVQADARILSEMQFSFHSKPEQEPTT